MSGLILFIIIVYLCCRIPRYHRYGYYGRRWHRPLGMFWDDHPPMGGFHGTMHHGPMDMGGMGHGNPFGGPHGGGHMGGFGGGMGHGGGAGRR